MIPHGIGIIGAGNIVRVAHVPAYRSSGLDIVGVYDVDHASVKALRHVCPDAKAFSTIEDLLADPRIDVVDVAVPPRQQILIAPRIIESGKHILCHKPLGPTLGDARDLVNLAQERGITMAVNQNMRWEPLIQAIKRSLEDGTIGTPTAGLIELSMILDFPATHWLASEERLEVMNVTIHHLDAARYLFGEPTWVTARLFRDPRQMSRGETWVNVWLEWPGGLCLVIYERCTNWAGDLVARMRIEGTNGTIRGRFGVWEDPLVTDSGGRPDHVERLVYGHGSWEPVPAEGSWIPGAFSGPMCSLLEAIDGSSEPPTSGADNLFTMRLVEAVYLSDRERRSVRPEEIAEL